jgi:chloramphenicol-sensitive protein RarD
MKKNEVQLGAIYAGFSYLLWGFLPVYWKFLDHLSADEILANRVFWSLVFMVFVLVFTKKWGALIENLKELVSNKKRLFALAIASMLISTNWFVYIWAVNSNQMVEASLGYYINPLVSVLLGMFVLKEKLSSVQYISFILAAIGVCIITFTYGRFPWIAMTLALSFGLYGLAKKLLKVDSAIGLTMETMIVTPVAVIYLVVLFFKGSNSFFTEGLDTDLLLMGAGAATAIPLLYFAKGAQKIPLSMLGFLQYIAPTITLILGIFVYGEEFSKIQLLSFVFIWSALTVYSLSKTRLFSGSVLKLKKDKGLGA